MAFFCIVEHRASDSETANDLKPEGMLHFRYVRRKHISSVFIMLNILPNSPRNFLDYIQAYLINRYMLLLSHNIARVKSKRFVFLFVHPTKCHIQRNWYPMANCWIVEYNIYMLDCRVSVLYILMV